MLSHQLCDGRVGCPGLCPVTWAPWGFGRSGRVSSLLSSAGAAGRPLPRYLCSRDSEDVVEDGILRGSSDTGFLRPCMGSETRAQGYDVAVLVSTRSSPALPVFDITSLSQWAVAHLTEPHEYAQTPIHSSKPDCVSLLLPFWRE